MLGLRASAWGSDLGSAGVRMWDRDYGELSDTAEIVGVGSIDGEAVRDCDCGDEGVEGTGGGFPPRLPKFGCDLAEGASGGSVERQRVEVSFGLLEMSLSGCPFGIGPGYERTHRQFSERDCGDCRHRREGRWLGQLGKKDDRAGVEDAAASGVGHRV